MKRTPPPADIADISSDDVDSDLAAALALSLECGDKETTPVEPAAAATEPLPDSVEGGGPT